MKLLGLLIVGSLVLGAVPLHGTMLTECRDRLESDGDCDGDGVPEAADICRETPRGLPAAYRGCASVELVGQPHLLLGPVHAALDEVVEGGSSDPSLDKLSRLIGKAQEHLRSTGDLVRSGDPCRGNRKLSRVERDLTRAGDTLREAIAAVPRSGATGDGPDSGDAGEADVRKGYLGLRLGRLADARAALSAASMVVGGLCDAAANEFRLVTRIVDVDDDSRIIQITEGGPLALAVGQLGKEFSAGQEVTIAGAGDVVTSVDGVKVGKKKDFLAVQCLDLRIAPVQRFHPISSGPYELHRPEAYFVPGAPPGGFSRPDSHLLERGMRLAVERRSSPSCHEPASPELLVPFFRYSVLMTLHYENCNGKQDFDWIAQDMNEGDAPVTLPCVKDIDNVPATLTFVERRQTCRLIELAGRTALDCGPFQYTRTEKYALSIRPQRQYCHAHYEETVFDLEDDDLSGFRVTRVTTLDTNFESETAPSFAAEGRKVIGGELDPNVGPIHQGDDFAISTGDFVDSSDFFYQQKTGVPKYAGLQYPAVTGSRNGHPFRYSCGLPGITRDLLDRCEFPVDDSYYRLPFADGYPTWIMSQGNENPDPTATHCVENVDGVPCYNRFAFDFVANAGTPILAARGGTVIWVDESNTANCSPCDGCTEAPNSVFIEHEDGTVGVYFHMQPNGVFVSAGDRVKRGDLIAAVGNTGCSSQPHLHFQEDPEIGASQSSRSSFETAILKEVPFVGAVCDFGEMAVCQVPEPGDGLCSTNEP